MPSPPSSPVVRNVLEFRNALVTWVIFSSTGPLALAYFALSWWGRLCDVITFNVNRLPRYVEAWLLTEALWFVAVRACIATLLERAPHARPIGRNSVRRSRSREAIAKLFEEELDDAANARTLIGGWFFGAEYGKLRKQDVLDWWAWVALCAPSLGEIQRKSVEDGDEVRRLVEKVEERCGALGEDETSPARRAVKLNCDAVSDFAMCKPLWLYLALRCGSEIVARLALRYGLGFKRRRFGRVDFWVWTLADLENNDADIIIEDKEPAPLVFVHGLGVGLLPYLTLLRDLVRDAVARRRAAILVPDLYYVAAAPPPEVAARGGIPDLDEHVDAVRAAVRRSYSCSDDDDNVGCNKGTQHTFAEPDRRRRRHIQFDVFAHSYGTVLAGWLARVAPDEVRALALAEPISVLLHHSRVARSFLYDRPEDTSLGQAVVRRAIANDAFIVHTLMRHFYWFENTLFLQDLKALDVPPLLLLSEHDEHVPSALIRARVQQHQTNDANSKNHNGPADASASPLRVVWLGGAVHGEVVRNRRVHQTYIDEFRALVDRAAAKSPTS